MFDGNDGKQYENPCTSRKYDTPKQRFPTRDLAWCASSLRQITGGHLRYPYHCPKCGYYHLTTARGEKKPWVRNILKRIAKGEGIHENRRRNT